MTATGQRGTGTPVIRTHGLMRRYRSHTALGGVNLTVERGSAYALVGPNGAGKTTLIQTLMNLQPASAGEAEVLGLPVQQVRGRALEKIGYISENQEMPEWMTVATLLDYLRTFYPTWDRELEGELLRAFALPRDRKLKHLSRGMRMKAAFVGALSFRPELLVLDEPFSGLDPLVRDELIEGLVDRIGETTLFLSSHDLADIENFASHVGYLQQGRLVFSEEMASLSQRFRRIELQSEIETVATTLPSTWMEMERSGSIVRFVHAGFTGEESAAAEVRQVFSAAGEMRFLPMSLREIFVTQARTAERRSGKMEARA